MAHNHHDTENISLNLNIRGLEQSPTLAINELCRKLYDSGKTIYNTLFKGIDALTDWTKILK